MQTFMDGIQDVVAIVGKKENEQFYFEFFNKAAKEYWGLDDQAIGKTVYELFPEELTASNYKYYDEIMRKKEVIVFTQEIEKEEKYIEITLTPLLVEDGSCSYIVVVLKDISKEVIEHLKNEDGQKQLEITQSRYTSLFEHNKDAIFTIDLEGYILEGNEAVEILSGYKVKELQGKHFNKLFELENRKELQHLFNMATEGIFEEYRLNIVTKSGESFGCLVKFIPIKVKNEIISLFLFIKDMRVLDNLAEKFLESEMNFRIIAENIQDVIILMNNKFQYVYVSPSSKDVFGFNYTNIDNREPFFNIHPNDVLMLEQEVNQAIDTGEPFKITLKAFHEERGWIWAELNGTPAFDHQHNFRHMVLVARDISMQKQYEEELHFYAYHDTLTKLPNRRYLKKQLKEVIEQLNDYGRRFAVLLLDIDDFKDVNDCFGHDAGDKVIQTFGNRLVEVVGEHGVVARLGGDEFVILLKDMESEEFVTSISEEIQRRVAKPMDINGQPLIITTSIGVSFCRTSNVDVHNVLKSADDALYEVKNMGKSKYHINHS